MTSYKCVYVSTATSGRCCTCLPALAGAATAGTPSENILAIVETVRGKAGKI